jgi:hypothetical protein
MAGAVQLPRGAATSVVPDIFSQLHCQMLSPVTMMAHGVSVFLRVVRIERWCQFIDAVHLRCSEIEL